MLSVYIWRIEIDGPETRIAKIFDLVFIFVL